MVLQFYFFLNHILRKFERTQENTIEKTISKPHILKRFARGSPRSVLLAFSQSYVEHDLRKNKIVVLFFCQPINFYEFIVRF
jgi:hypothetical protein